MVNTPEYGYKVLSKFDKVLKRDYNKILNGQYAKERGVSLLIYVDIHNLNIWIDYLENKIHFQIELEQNTILSSWWNINDVNESVMDYFEFIVSDIITDLDKRSKNLYSFDIERKWISIDKKIDKIFH